MSIPCASTAAATRCHQCGDRAGLFMHQVMHLGTIKSLCTDCVLHLNPSSLCPICLEVHQDLDTLSSEAILWCERCFSSSHISCIGSKPDSPYLCTMCVNPNSPLLVLSDMNEGKVMIDMKAARVLRAACKISAYSMRKAAQVAKEDLMAKVKEAASARENATKAMKHLNDLITKQNIE